MPNDKISNAEFNTAGNLRYENMDAFIDCDEFRKAVTGYGTIDWKYETTDPRKPERIIRLVNANISDKLFADISPDGSPITTAELDHYISQKAHLYAPEDHFIHNTINAWQSVDPKDDGTITFIEVDLLYHIMTHMHYGEPKSPPGNGHLHYAHIEVDKFKKIWSPAHGETRAKRADLKATVESIEPDLRPARLMKIKSNHPTCLGEQYLLALKMQDDDPQQYGAFALQSSAAVLRTINPALDGMTADHSALLDEIRTLYTALKTPAAKTEAAQTQRASDIARLKRLTSYSETPPPLTPALPARTEIIFGLQ